MIFEITGGTSQLSGSEIWVHVTDIGDPIPTAENYELLCRFTEIIGGVEQEPWNYVLYPPFIDREAWFDHISIVGLCDLKVEIGESYNDSALDNEYIENWDPTSQTIHLIGASGGDPGSGDGGDPDTGGDSGSSDDSPVPGGVVQLSGNPIEIRILATSGMMSGKSNYKLALKVTCDALMGSPFVEEITPDAHRASVFDISGYVDQPIDIEFENPPLTKIVAHPALFRTVTIDSGEVYIDGNGDRAESWTGVISDLQLRIIKGKLRPYELALLNDDSTNFNQEYILAGKFLTHLPQNQKVSPLQVIKLWFMSRWPANHSSTLHFLAENTAGSDYEYTENFIITPASGLIEINVNPAMMGFNVPPSLPPGSIVTAYTVWMEDATGDITERRRFVVDNRYYEKQWFFYYRNPFSAVDSIWLTGEYVEKLKTEIETAYRPVPSGSGTKVASLATITASGQRSWTLNTGFKTVAELRALRDFLEARERWMVDPERIGGNYWKLIPVIIDAAEYDINDSQNDIPNFDIDILEAHI